MSARASRDAREPAARLRPLDRSHPDTHRRGGRLRRRRRSGADARRHVHQRRPRHAHRVRRAAALAQAADEARTALVEMVAETNDSLMEVFFENGSLSQDQLEAGLRDATSDGALPAGLRVGAARDWPRSRCSTPWCATSPPRRAAVRGHRPGRRRGAGRPPATAAPTPRWSGRRWRIRSRAASRCCGSSRDLHLRHDRAQRHPRHPRAARPPAGPAGQDTDARDRTARR